jgi:D-alanyl-D-alanine carboxypeptidase-like protein
MKGLLAGAAAAACALLACAPAGAAVQAASGRPVFHGTITRIDAALADRMTPTSWRPGCPVRLADLRLLTVTHWGFDRRVRTGRLVVHEDWARAIRTVMRKLYRAGYPIRRMQLIDAYGGSDFASIEADNTSAFNCRAATGSGNWSQHAYGLAIDLNPIENPYVENGRVYHDASRPYLDRSKRLKGMIRAGGTVVRAFASIGWGWGGSWSGGVKDYQHFSASGR